MFAPKNTPRFAVPLVITNGSALADVKRKRTKHKTRRDRIWDTSWERWLDRKIPAKCRPVQIAVCFHG